MRIKRTVPYLYASLCIVSSLILLLLLPPSVFSQTWDTNDTNAGYIPQDEGPIIDLIGKVANLTPAQVREIEEIQNRTRPKPDRVRFPSGHVIPNPRGFEINTVNVDAYPKSVSDPSKIHGVIQFKGPIKLEEVNFIESHGIFLDEALGHYAYLATIPINKLGSIEQSKFVKWLGKVPKEGKIRNKVADEIRENPEESFKIYVSIFEDVNDADARPELEKYVNEIISYAPVSHFYDVSVNGSQISNILDLEFVKRIEKVTTRVPVNANGLPATAADTVLGLEAYDGSGVNISIVDTGVAYSDGTKHPDLPTPIDQYDFCENGDNLAEDSSSHGTHVTGIALGRGNRISYYGGVAPGANLMAYKFLNCSWSNYNFEDVLIRSANRSAQISSNSWGWDGSNGEYREDSRIVDRAVLGEYRDANNNKVYMTVVVAAGNDDDLVSDPGTNKNGITVGSAKIGNDDNRNYNWAPCFDSSEPAADYVCDSNFGPIGPDNRIKPDVIAPGHVITSTYPWYLNCNNPSNENDNYYCKDTGTSMATPHVSGILALMMDRYGKVQWPETKKARLLGSSIYLPNVPANRQGHGHVSAYYAVYDQQWVFEQLLWYGSQVNPSSPTHEITFDVPTTAYKEVEVMMAYSDQPGEAIDNDVDIFVYDSNGVLVGSDTRQDTTKRVSVPPGSPGGTWKVVVDAVSIRNQTKYGVFVSLRRQDPDLYIALPSEEIVSPGESFVVFSTLGNSGFSTVGSYITLKLPSDFTLSRVRIARNDLESFYLNANELYYNSSENSYRVSVGAVIKDYPRYIDWIITAPSTEGSYNLNFKYGAQNFAEYQKNVDVEVTTSPSTTTTTTTVPPTTTTTTTTTTTIPDTTPPTVSFSSSSTPPDGATLNQNYAYIEISASETINNAYLEWNGVNESMSGSGTVWSRTKVRAVNSEGLYRRIEDFRTEEYLRRVAK